MFVAEGSKSSGREHGLALRCQELAMVMVRMVESGRPAASGPVTRFFLSQVNQVTFTLELVTSCLVSIVGT